MARFGDREFQLFSQLIDRQFGIRLTPAKQFSLQTKLDHLLCRYGLSDYQELYGLLNGPKRQLCLSDLADEITVNKTDFFREISHFDYLRRQLPQMLQRNNRVTRSQELRAWSAGCSTGEEPYTLAMVLLETLPATVRIRILATDISRQVLAQAQAGVYAPAVVQQMDRRYLQKYFHPAAGGYAVNDVLRRLVTFRLFNLMELFPMREPLDIIFCRNVMIYFSQTVQEALLQKFHEALAPGGLLFIGHSESLSNHRHGFHYLQPTIYQRK